MTTQQTADPLQPGLAFYCVMKPGPVLGADGNPQYAIIAQTQDLGQAIMLMNQTPGAAVMLNFCLAKTPPAVLTAKK